MKKIIIIDHEQLTIRRKDLFKLDELRSAGFDVEFWDVSILISDMIICDQIDDEGLYKIKTTEEFNDKLSGENIANCLFVVEIGYDWSNRKLINILRQHNCFCIKLELYASNNFKATLIRKLLSLSIPLIWSFLECRIKIQSFKIYCKLNSMPPELDYIITSNSISRVDTLINHPDWERAQSIKERSEIIPSKPYVVYLDDFYPLHPDFQKNGLVGKLGDATLHHNNFNNLFSMIERDLKLDVIIAAHPKAYYTPDTFQNRPIIKYKTEELVKYSEGVISLCSTSIAYALIFNKKILMARDKEALKDRSGSCFQLKIADSFNLCVYDIEKIEKITDNMFKFVDQEIVDNYIHSFITSPKTKDITTTEILIDTFNKL